MANNKSKKQKSKNNKSKATIIKVKYFYFKILIVFWKHTENMPGLNFHNYRDKIDTRKLTQSKSIK